MKNDQQCPVSRTFVLTCSDFVVSRQVVMGHSYLSVRSKVAAATALPSPGASVAHARARAVNEAQLRSPLAKKGAAAALGTDQPAAALGWKWKSSGGLFLD